MLSNSNSVTPADLEIAMLLPQSPKRKKQASATTPGLCLKYIYIRDFPIFFLHEVILHICSNFSKRTSKYFNLLSITIFKNSLYCKIILNTKSIAYILCYKYFPHKEKPGRRHKFFLNFKMSANILQPNSVTVKIQYYVAFICQDSHFSKYPLNFNSFS